MGGEEARLRDSAGRTEFGRLLREHRERALLSQEGLAHRAGLSTRAIRDLEAGRTGRPRAASVRLLVEALDLQGSPRAAFEAAARDGTSIRAPNCQLPPDVADFTGRGREAAALRARLAAASGDSGPADAVVVSAVAGKAGVGKTALAVHVAHQLRVGGQFPDGQLYVNLRGTEQPSLEPAAVLARFLRALGVQGPTVPEDPEEREAMYRARLAGRRVLVVLDDAAGEAQVRPLVPGVPGCAVLVTSRRRLTGLEGARLVELEVLPPGQARELLSRVVGAARTGAEPEAAAAIVAYCGYLPLAVRVAGARLAARRRWPLRWLADRLADERGRLSELSAGDLEVRASLSLSDRALDAEERRALRLLAALDVGDFAAWVAAPLLDVPAQRAEGLVERLVDAQLLDLAATDVTGRARYRFHDLVRAYAREQTGAHRPGQGAAATASEHQRVEAVGRLLRWYLATARRAALLVQPVDLDPLTPEEAALALPLDHRDAALRWFEAERSNLLAAVGQAAGERAWAEPCIALACTLAPLVRSSGHGEEWERSYRVALRVAQELQNRPAEARIHVELSILRSLAGDNHASVRNTEDALAAYRMAGDRAGEARSLNNLGALYHKLSRLPEAMGAYEEGLDLARRIGHRRYQAYATANLAAMRRDLGRPGEAVDLDLVAIALFRDIGDPHGQADATDDLALAHRAAGRHEEALAAHRAALGIVRDLADLPREGRILRELATTLLHAGDAGQAVTVLRQSLAVLAQARDRYGEAHARRQLGAVLQVLGDREHAARCWREALSIFTELGTPEAHEVRLELAGLPPGEARPLLGCRRGAGTPDETR
jgi:tetratricopeptide (TPR) repeat protein/transcriptional regulator with XRE-family HTH domain